MSPVTERGSLTERARHANAQDVEPSRRIIVLPDVPPADSLAEEFGDRLPTNVIERAVAAARHALERARRPATDEAVDQLAREHLRARIAAVVSRRPS